MLDYFGNKAPEVLNLLLLEVVKNNRNYQKEIEIIKEQSENKKQIAKINRILLLPTAIDILVNHIVGIELNPKSWTVYQQFLNQRIESVNKFV